MGKVEKNDQLVAIEYHFLLNSYLLSILLYLLFTYISPDIDPHSNLSHSIYPFPYVTITALIFIYFPYNLIFYEAAIFLPYNFPDNFKWQVWDIN